MPVTLADIRARVLDDLKRKDVTTATLDRWIMDGVRRIQRSLRTPMDEAISVAIIPEGFAGAISVPGNLIEAISLQVDGRELEMRSVTEVKALQTANGTHQARFYVREADQYLIAPLPPVGAKFLINYRADPANPVAATDSLKLFDVAPDLVTVAALINGSKWSIDDKRLITFNSMYNALFAELQDLADRAELLNASIRPAYDANGDWNP